MPLRNAPHTVHDLVERMDTGPIRARRLFSGRRLRAIDKYWSPVGRVDNVYGDRNLVCACPPIEDYALAAE